MRATCYLTIWLVKWTNKRERSEVARASRPLWRERPAPALQPNPERERDDRQPRCDDRKARAGCPCHSGRDARPPSASSLLCRVLLRRLRAPKVVSPAGG